MNDVKAQTWPPVIGLTIDEAAQALRVDIKTVRTAIKSGGLPARLVGRGWRIEVEALRLWLAQGTGEGRKVARPQPQARMRSFLPPRRVRRHGKTSSL